MKTYETNLGYHAWRLWLQRPCSPGWLNGVLVVAHVSGPFANTVYGLTPRRLWATAAVVPALAWVWLSVGWADRVQLEGGSKI